MYELMSDDDFERVFDEAFAKMKCKHEINVIPVDRLDFLQDIRMMKFRYIMGKSALFDELAYHLDSCISAINDGGSKKTLLYYAKNNVPYAEIWPDYDNAISCSFYMVMI